MSYGRKKHTRVTLPSDANYWIDLDTSLTYGEVKALKIDDADSSDASDKYLNIAIKAWNLDDESGTVLEINQANIDLLQQDDFLALAEVIRNADGSAKEKKSS